MKIMSSKVAEFRDRFSVIQIAFGSPLPLAVGCFEHLNDLAELLRIGCSWERADLIYNHNDCMLWILASVESVLESILKKVCSLMCWDKNLKNLT